MINIRIHSTMGEPIAKNPRAAILAKMGHQNAYVVTIGSHEPITQH